MTSRGIFLFCLAVALSFFGLACLGFGLPGDMAIALITGWVWFMARTAVGVTVDWAAMAVSALSLALLAFGLHRFLLWFYPAVAVGSERTCSDWPLRWTMAAVSITVLMFCAGVSMIGITHQIVWLLSSKEPFLTHRGASYPSRRSQSSNNLKQIGLAFHNYHDTWMTFPPGGTFDQSGQPFHGWQTFLLPFVDQAPLFEQIALGDPWDDPQNAEAFRTKLTIYTNPGVNSDETLGDKQAYATSHYAGNGWVAGGQAGLRISDIRDGIATTLLAGEVAANFKPWGDPTNWRAPQLGINKSPAGFGGPFKNGSFFLLADGAVRFLSENIDPQVLKALSTPSGGEPVKPDDY